MSVAIDIRGNKYGRLLAIEPMKERCGSSIVWKCLCDCGNVHYASVAGLKKGTTQSCGCLRDEMNRIRNSKTGLSGTRLYSIYSKMLSRCNNEKNKSFFYYGKRGIKVCDEWSGENGLTNFYNWAINNGYSEGLSIDRIDNNGNYEPQNCRWASQIEQSNNKSNNLNIEYLGECKTLAEWCRELNISYTKTLQRLRRGWNFEDAVSKEIEKERKVIAIDSKGNEIVFNSLAEAGRVTKTHTANIFKCCKGLRNKAGNYKWKYL